MSCAWREVAEKPFIIETHSGLLSVRVVVAATSRISMYLLLVDKFGILANSSSLLIAGKALGGTSTINGATYVRAQKAQIDAWERLGNAGWNWESLLPYYKKAENLHPPDAMLTARGAEYEPNARGFVGPVDVGWSNYTMGGDAHDVLNETWQAIGLPYNQDQSSGELRGFSVFPSTIDSVHNVRADAARSYYWPVMERKNLHVFTNTLAEKLLWSESDGVSDDLVCANGVQIRSKSGGDSRVVEAKMEVILSAGSLKSPVILENSGIGNPAILSKYGIDVKVNLPTVGENLQDQSNVLMTATAKTNWSGYPPFVTFATASDLFGSNTSDVASYVNDNIPEYAAAIIEHSNKAYDLNMVKDQLRIQAEIIFKQDTPCSEIVLFPTNTSVTAAFWGMLPFSRGSVHLSSTNASSTPLINPNFFMLDWDAMLQTASANLIRKVFHTAPLGDFVGVNTLPNDTVVPNDAEVEEWLPWFKESCEFSVPFTSCCPCVSNILKPIDNPNYHPCGTCAMMDRSLGGVVSPELLVYGTSNVRVVDASVLPSQVDGHLTSTLYAIAERASDIIKRESSKYS